MNPETLVILGVPFHKVTFSEAVAWAVERVRERTPSAIATANVDFLMQAWRDPEMQRILIEADLVIADGQPIVTLSRWLGPRLKQRVTGSDLTPLLAEAARDNGFSIFGLGGAPGIAERATRTLCERYPGLQVAGTFSPPKADILAMDHDRILEAIRKARPDIVFVAFGAPKQEKWVNMHLRKWRVPLALGVGGTLDFLAGTQIRAPRWVQRIGAEWVWRFGTDPRRLFRRYASNLGFLIGAVLQLVAVRMGPVRRSACVARPSVPELAAWNAHGIAFEPHPENCEGQRAFVAAVSDAGLACTVIVDLGQVGWLSSLELGSLLDAGRQCRRNDTHLVLVNVSGRVMRLLRLYRLDRHLTVVSDRGELVNACKKLACARGNTGTFLQGKDSELIFLLPPELTAANMEGVRKRFAAALEREQTGEKPPRVVRFDATLMDFLDSSGLGFLVSQRRTLEGRGVWVEYTGFHGAALQTIEISRVQKLLFGEGE